MDTLSAAVLETARAMNGAGINRGAAGNVSARCEGGFVITPTGMSYSECMPSDMATVDFHGVTSGPRRPSSEWRIHRDIYLSYPQAGAVIHAHSPFATALACQELEIPPFHYMIARFGGDTIPCAAYATFGTQELSDMILKALSDRCACLMSHHGMVLYGQDLHNALSLAIELEALCEQFWRVSQLGTPKLLDGAEMLRVSKLFESYGKQPTLD